MQRIRPYLALLSMLFAWPLNATAMNVSQHGLGQVLLFPYYTVRNGYDTLLSVTNTSASTVVARVRFREALNGREVAAFNVVLAPNDVWTGAATSNAAGDGAVIRTYDRTCTAPFFPVGVGVTGRELAFHQLAYTGSASDGASQSLERVREGYIEVIAMGWFTSEASRVPMLARHGVNGIPVDCLGVAAAGAADYGPALLDPPSNVLAGAATLIHVANGIALDVPATHIEGFSDQKSIWFPPDSPHPDLADGDAAEAATYFDDGVRYTDPIPTNSADTISALLMTEEIINEFAADGLGAMTSWVVTFPTKRHYVDRPTAVPPFTDIFGVDGKACEAVGNSFRGREAQTEQFSGYPPPFPGRPAQQLCHGANVIDFNTTLLFGGGSNHFDVATIYEKSGGAEAFNATAGWAGMTLVGFGQGIGTAKAPVSRGASGLPAIGFAAIVRNNASEAGNNRNYGSTIPHHIHRDHYDAYPPGQAMNVSQHGLGQVLLFPYYTVKNGYDTLLSVTNTSASTVVARVRFREALNGREVAAFNVVLAPFDVWTGAATSNAAGDGAVIRTYDRTCTAPFFPVGVGVTGRELAFHQLAYTGSASDGASQSLERVREGYIEVIAMGSFISEASRVPELARHGANGVPRDCPGVAAAGAADYGPALLDPPRNVLAGAATLIHVAKGIALDVPVTHIEGFSDQKSIWFPPDSPHPDLADGDAGEAASYFSNGRAFTDPIPTNSADTISALLMTDSIINEFAADGLGAMTSWVVTFPTKRHYVDRPTAVPPFTDIFGDDGKACETVGYRLWSREAQTEQFLSNWPPMWNDRPSRYLCHGTNVIDFNAPVLFGGGSNHFDIDTVYEKGSWAAFNVPAGWAIFIPWGIGLGIGPANAPVTLSQGGLPAIGFAAIVRNNASEAGNNRNYGSTIPHRHVRY